MVSITADFLTTKLLFCHDMNLPQSLTKTFSGVRNPNPASVGGKYALDFFTKEALLSQDIDFRQSLTKGFRGWEIQIPVSDGQNYAFDFLTKKALLSRDVDFRQSLTKHVVDEQFESLIGFSKTSIMQKSSDQTLLKINIWAQECFLTEKMRSDVYHFHS